MTTANTRQLRLSSIPMVHSPGMIRYILESVAPFDEPKAIDLLDAMGLNAEDSCRIVAKDPRIKITFDEDAGTVLFTIDDTGRSTGE